MRLSKDLDTPPAYEPVTPAALRAYARRLQRTDRTLSAADALRQAEADEKRRANAYKALTCTDETTGGAR